ncbi:uncharacterized protein LOC128235094 [Mya arenaria]|uniref:uncharacterized protein LOC128235094 n=1 Tax=Mya arenaria TaxID=6604 RepID=UPI0022E1E33D|nr:uncharacterized protein LOC128235094 [Mya arenaria]
MVIIFIVCFLGLCFAQNPSRSQGTEPSCYIKNRFEYEFGVLEKLENLQRDKNELVANVTALTAFVETLTRKIKGLNDPGGNTYIRWGKKSCPTNTAAELVYEGFAGGAPYDKPGNGANYICLPKDPQWGTDTSSSNIGYVHGAEYQMEGMLKDQDVPCAVCRTPSTNVLMIPARQECYEGWTKEYHGYLMAERHNHASNKEYICMDGEPEPRVGTKANVNGALLYFQEAVCGSLPCLPYNAGWKLTCVVCTFEPL